MKKALYRTYALLFLILAGTLASEASAQGMSGWSDEIVCLLILRKPDEPRYTEEEASRNLNCPNDNEQSAKPSKPKSNSSFGVNTYGGIDSYDFSEDFDTQGGQRDVQVNDRPNQWYIKQDNDGNSIYCNRVTDDWVSFKFGNEDWSNYSISLRVKFPAGRAADKAETYFRIDQSMYGYRSEISHSGQSAIAFYKPYDRIASAMVPTKKNEWMRIQLIVSGNNIKYLVNGQVVANVKDDKRKNGMAGFGASPNSEVCVDDIVVIKI